MTRKPRDAAESLAAAAAAPRRLLLLDFDGTLCPLRRRPELAHLTAAQRALLRALNQGRGRVAVVSGRSVEDLHKRVATRGLVYVGSFGLQSSGPDWRWAHPRAHAARPALRAFAGRLRLMFSDVPGALIEFKGSGICVHRRGVPPAHDARFERRLRRARAVAPAGLRWRRGPLSWEVAPDVAWDKGRAALALWRRFDRPFLLAIGDDRPDEPMLRAARARGAALRVGAGRSAARVRLKNPAAVWRFLRTLAERGRDELNDQTLRAQKSGL
ncbi:MAG: trehalose-phosphatase [Elusimicrobia bacterium]|nr:trehalose-phosphatase [Elusimicrobiota bacterium]